MKYPLKNLYFFLSFRPSKVYQYALELGIARFHWWFPRPGTVNMDTYHQRRFIRKRLSCTHAAYCVCPPFKNELKAFWQCRNPRDAEWSHLEAGKAPMNLCREECALLAQISNWGYGSWSSLSRLKSWRFKQELLDRPWRARRGGVWSGEAVRMLHQCRDDSAMLRNGNGDEDIAEPQKRKPSFTLVIFWMVIKGVDTLGIHIA